MTVGENSSGQVEEIEALLRKLHQDYRGLNQGRVHQWDPELEAADPNLFGICVVTAGGQMVAVGDCEAGFTMQSVSKPLVYGMVLEEHGREMVRTKIGVEPTGEASTSVVGHEQVSKGPYNPMINMGALATTSLIKGNGLVEREERVKAMVAKYVGHPVSVDESVHQARRHANVLNRALAYLMLSEERLEGDVEETITLYSRQCSLQTTCRDLALVAATLANWGVNPLTGQTAISREHVQDILSVMFSSGMYDFSGQWAYKVGLPSKSGLAGSILAVDPGRMGIAVYSPPLGKHNKSERGVRVLEEMTRRFHSHIFARRRSSARRRKPQAPAREPLQPLLEEIRVKYQKQNEGEVYNALPELYAIDRKHFGICAVTTSGEVFEAGDTGIYFLIQSISKVFTYGLALEDHGRAHVMRRVDVEPTGDAYNAVIRVEERSKRSHNPMVNTGGIATTSLVKGEGPAQRLDRVLNNYKAYIGHQVFIDMPAFLAEQASNDRNRAISYLLRSFGMMDGALQENLDLYLQQCSAILNCRDLAMMGATLANQGVNPVTRERAIGSHYIRDLLTVMYTCGMYDFTGEWAYNVGLPAKSGVSGAILGVVPGRLGLAVYSPPLDDRGNSIRAIKAFEELSLRLGLHIFHPGPSPSKRI